MTWFLNDGVTATPRLPDPFVRGAPRAPTSAGERYDAARQKGNILFDRQGGISDREKRAIRDLATRLGPDDESNRYTPPNLPGTLTSEGVANLRLRRYLRLAPQDSQKLFARAQAAAAADPEAWAGIATSEEALRAQITADLKAELEDVESVLAMAPADAFAVETIGEDIVSGVMTPENALATGASFLFGPPGWTGRAIGGRMLLEGTASAGVSLAELPGRAEVAERLGAPPPDPLTTGLVGFGAGFVLGGAFEGLAGAIRLTNPERRALAYQQARNALPSRTGRADPVELEAQVRAQEEALRSGDSTLSPAPMPMSEGMPEFDVLTAAVVRAESDGNPNAVSEKGAIGLMQLMPATARDPGYGVPSVFDVARSLGRDVADETDETLTVLLRDAEVNQAQGQLYLQAMIDKFGDLDASLAAYNAGPAAAEKWIASGRQRFALPAETRTYIRRVRNYLDRPGQSANALVERADVLVDPRGVEHPFRYEIVELDRLVWSHRDGMANPDFPAALQPRARDRAASSKQIEEIARGFNPRMVGRSTLASDGAPVIGADDVVEAGNGRTDAIRKVYDEFPEREVAYRQYLESEGLDITGFERPVLVRRRTAPQTMEERIAFAQASNARTTAAPGTAEQARSDAAGLPDWAIDLYRGGNITSAENREFVRRALQSLPTAEQSGMFTATGRLNREGAQRLERMIVAGAYRDQRVLELTLEQPDDLGLAVTGALQDIAPQALALRRQVESGEVDAAFDLGGAIAEATLRVKRAREEGVSVNDALDQRALFDADPDGLDRALTRALFLDDEMTKIAPRTRIRDRMNAILKGAGEQRADGGLFGNDLRLSAGEVARNVLRREGVEVATPNPAADRTSTVDTQPDSQSARPTESADPPANPGRDSGDAPDPQEAREVPAQDSGAASAEPARRAAAHPIASADPALARLEADLIDQLAADPSLANRATTTTDGESASVQAVLNDLEDDADLFAALNICDVGGKT